MATIESSGDFGFRVARFEFDYMARRRTSAARKPPPRAEKLDLEYIAAIDALAAKGPLIIGGKSMGGRVASMVADEPGRIAGLLCLGYPFHPLGKPDELRTEHLASLQCRSSSRRERETSSEAARRYRPTSFRRTSRSSGWRTATMSSNRERAYPVFQRPITSEH